MNMDEATRATRKYKVWRLSNFNWAVDGKEYLLHEEAQAACDRLNLLAVLEAIRDALMQEQGIDTKQERCIYDI